MPAGLRVEPFASTERLQYAGRTPQTKPFTEELARLLGYSAPKGDGETWAPVIAQALLAKAH